MAKIKEIAATCGVSDEAIRAWCRRKQVVKDAQGSFAINETTLLAIYQHYHVEEHKQLAQAHKQLAQATQASLQPISLPMTVL